MLESLWQEKSASVVIVDPTEKIRSLHGSFLKEGGFEKVQDVATIEDLEGLVAEGRVDWVVMSSYATDVLNAFTVLERTCAPGAWCGIRVSMLLESQEEKDILEFGLAKGLFSAHKRLTKKELLQKKWQDFFKKAEDLHWDRLKISADLTRRVLRTDPGRLIKFEHNLLRILPSYLDSWWSLSQATAEQFGKISYMQLDRLALIDPERSSDFSELKKRHLDSQEEVLLFPKIQKIYMDIQHKSVRKNFLESMKTLGLFTRVESLSTGAARWDFLRDAEADAVFVLEGDFHTICRTCEFLRAQRRLDTPIICFSDGLDQDMALRLSHVGVVDVGNVIWNESQIIEMFCEAFEEWRIPRADDVVVQKSKQQFLYEGSHHLIQGCRFVGEVAHEAEGLLQLTRDEDTQSAVLGPELPALRLMKQGFFEQASERLQSWDASMMTIHHGCLLVWALYCSGKPEEAYQQLQKVVKISPPSFNLPDVYRAVLDTLEKKSSVHKSIRQLRSRRLYFQLLLEYTNIVCRDAEDVEKVWRSVQLAMPEERLEDQIVAIYNLCLFFAKSQRISQARREIKLALKVDHPYLKKEMISLDKRLEFCLKSKKNFEPLIPRQRKNLDNFKGRLGCYRVFLDPRKTTLVNQMMKKPAIKRLKTS